MTAVFGVGEDAGAKIMDAGRQAVAFLGTGANDVDRVAESLERLMEDEDLVYPHYTHRRALEFVWLALASSPKRGRSSGPIWHMPRGQEPRGMCNSLGRVLVRKNSTSGIRWGEGLAQMPAPLLLSRRCNRRLGRRA